MKSRWTRDETWLVAFSERPQLRRGSQYARETSRPSDAASLAFALDDRRSVFKGTNTMIISKKIGSTIRCRRVEQQSLPRSGKKRSASGTTVAS